MLKEFGTAIRITIVLGVVVCGLYPLVVWVIGQVAFHRQANGSLIYQHGKIIGSSLLAQSFTKPEYFQPRPSAAGNNGGESAAGSGYDPTQSGATNLGPTSDKLINGQHKTLPDGKPDPTNIDGVGDLVTEYRAFNNLAPDTPVPVDAVTRSGSGLDPQISLANANLQAKRVAAARRMPLDDVKKLIDENTDGRSLGFLGEPGVNVLMLNLALDRAHPMQLAAARQ